MSSSNVFHFNSNRHKDGKNFKSTDNCSRAGKQGEGQRPVNSPQDRRTKAKSRNAQLNLFDDPPPLPHPERAVLKINPIPSEIQIAPGRFYLAVEFSEKIYWATPVQLTELEAIWLQEQVCDWDWGLSKLERNRDLIEIILNQVNPPPGG